MLKCPICDIDLNEISLRRGRCQACGGLLVWEDESPSVPATPAPEPAWSDDTHVPLHHDEDQLDDGNQALRQVVQQIAERERGGARSPAAPSAAAPPSGGWPAPEARQAGDVETGARVSGRPDAQTPAVPLDQVAQLWKQSISSTVTPRTTLKSASDGSIAATGLVIQARTVSASEEAISQTVDYELLDVIGEGGVGVVYAARQASINRTVALKMLKPLIKDDADQRNKFLSEAVVTGDLEHPNIVPIYDLGTNDSGALFYAMKRVHGTPWSGVVQTHSLAENLRVLMSVADAIAFAHARGIIHRDLKPENVMLGDFGEVLVMDWGIALSTPMFVKSGVITQSTSMGGTPAYMAPEMATGPVEAIGPASDVYLLGAILYEVVTGQPPHTGEDVMSCVYAAARNEIRPTDKSGELIDIAYRALATEPANRFASVQEFQAAIREYQSHSESIVLSARAEADLNKARRTRDYQDFSRALFAFQEARALWNGNVKAGTGTIETQAAYAQCALEKGDFDLGLSLLDPNQPAHRSVRSKLIAAEKERSTRSQRLRRLKVLALLLTGLTFVILTAGLIWVGIEKNRADVARKQAEDAAIGEKVAAAREKKAAKLARDAEIGQRIAAQDARREADKALKAETDAVNAAEGERQAADDARRQRQAAEAASYVAQIGLAAERIASNAFLDAQRVLAVYEQPDNWQLRDWEWGHLLYLCRLDALAQSGLPPLVMDARIEAVDWSHDGRYLVAGSVDGRVQIWDAKSYSPLAQQSHGAAIRAVAISQDGRQVATAGELTGETAEIKLWELSADGRQLALKRTLTGHAQEVLSLRFSPDQQHLISSSRDETARLWDCQTGAQRQAFRGHFGPVWCAAFRPDGTHVVTAGEDSTVRIWSSATGAEVTRFRGHRSAVFAAAFSPDGRYVASAGREQRILIWEPDRIDGFDFDALQKQLASEQTEAASTATVASNQQPVVQVLEGHTAEVRTLTFSARFGGREGRFLLSGGHDNVVGVWNLQAPRGAPDSVQMFRGHGGWVRSAAFSPDGSFVISGGYDNQVKIWDAERYEEVRVLRDQNSPVTAAAFARDAARVITGGRDGVAWLWNLADGTPLGRLSDSLAEDHAAKDSPDAELLEAGRLREGHEFLVSAACFFPRGDQRVLTSAGDNTVRLWDLVTGGQIRLLSHTGQACALTLSDDARWILTGSDQQSALLWDLAKAQTPPDVLPGQGFEITAVAISRGGGQGERLLFTGDANGQCRLWKWDRQQWQPYVELEGHLPGYSITAAYFLPGNREILTACQDHTVARWDTATGERINRGILPHADGVRSLDVSQDGRHAVTLCLGTAGYQMTYWDLDAAREIQKHLVTDQMVTSLVFGRNDKEVLAAITDTRRGSSAVWRWDLDGGSLQPLWSDSVYRGSVWSAVTAPDGTRLLTIGDSQARLWDDESGQLLQTFSAHGPLTSVNISPSGKLAVTASTDGSFKIWSVDAEAADYLRDRLKKTLAHDRNEVACAVNSAVFSPLKEDDDRHVLTAGDDGAAKLWEISGSAVREVTSYQHADRVRSAVFSPDARLIATACQDGTVHIWDTMTGDGFVLGAPQTHSLAVLCVQFSADGKWLATGSDDNTVKLWDLTSRTQKELLSGHTASITSVAFSADGRRIVSGARDGMAKIWDVESGNQLLSLRRHTAEVTAVDFSRDGRSVLTASADQTAIIWLSEEYAK